MMRKYEERRPRDEQFHATAINQHDVAEMFPQQRGALGQLDSETVLHLQRMAGNAGVSALLGEASLNLGSSNKTGTTLEGNRAADRNVGAIVQRKRKPEEEQLLEGQPPGQPSEQEAAAISELQGDEDEQLIDES